MGGREAGGSGSVVGSTDHLQEKEELVKEKIIVMKLHLTSSGLCGRQLKGTGAKRL